MSEFESMNHMAKRLEGTGGGSQAEAVLAAAELINSARGILDRNNAESAIIHLAIEIAGKDHAADLILRTAQRIDPESY